MKNKLIYLLFPLLLTGCFDIDTPDGPLVKLYEQRIPHSSLIIYKFDYYGNFATLSDYTGLTILDSSVPFKRDKIKKLPAYYFSAIPNSKVLKMVVEEFDESAVIEKDTLLTPDRQYSKRINGVQIDVTEYKPTYGSSRLTTLMEYRFDGIKETDDSLTFFNVVNLSGATKFSSTISFEKGNIQVSDSGDNKINHIDIDRFIVQRDTITTASPRYAQIADRPVVGVATYHFFPKTSIKTSLLSDYGIFKRIK